MSKLERKFLAHYIDSNMGDDPTMYVRLGKDLETYSEELNPQVNIQRDLCGNPNIVFDGYQVQSKAEHYYAEQGDALFEALSRIANDRITDESCKTTKVDALFDSEGNQIWAYREDCWLIPISVGGDTSGVQIPFSVYCAGNRTYGTFNVTTRMFTPEDEPEREGVVIPLSVTHNGTFSAPAGKAYDPVVVSVPGNISVSALTVTSNGTYTSPSGAYNPVTVSVPVVSLTSFSTSQNGTFSAPANTGYSQVTVSVLPTPITISQNGTYTNPDGKGYSPIYVDVSGEQGHPDDAIIEKTISGIYVNPRVSKVGSYAFYRCYSLTGLVFSNVSSVGESAFAYCSSVNSISFPECYSIGNYAFYYARSIQEASFPKCTYIGSYAFTACYSLSTVSFPSCTRLEGYAFMSCSVLKQVTFPEVYYIGYMAFGYDPVLESVDFPSCTTVGQYAFRDCYVLSNVNLPLARSIYTGAFMLTSALQSVSFPTLYDIGASAFYRCGLLSVYFPSAAFFSAQVFASCSQLSLVSLPAASQMSASVFGGCTRLVSLYLMSTSVVALKGSSHFFSTPIGGYSDVAGQYGSVYVPASLLTAYQSASGWSSIADRIVGI